MRVKVIARRIVDAVSQGYRKYQEQLDTGSLLATVLVCVWQLVIMWVFWHRFYSGLADKIKATEYILTFIPADSLNQNPKIVSFIHRRYLKK